MGGRLFNSARVVAYSVAYGMHYYNWENYENIYSLNTKLSAHTNLNINFNLVRQQRKPRFLQFEPPFSDESQHSTSAAVILDGKYWKKRLHAVSRDFKKWRRKLDKDRVSLFRALLEELQEILAFYGSMKSPYPSTN